MSPTQLYDPEVITARPTISRVDIKQQRPRPAGGPFKSPKFLAALLVVPSVLAIFAVMLLSAEMVLGLVGLGNDEYLKIDPIMGLVHLEDKFVDFRLEGFSKSRISKAGLRDVEHQVAKPSGVTRIAFIGDSKTQGLQVNIPETFVRLVEDKLNADAGKGVSSSTSASPPSAPARKRFETINFGMSTYGVIQYYLEYLTKVRPYSPDVTVVVYHVFDSTENLPKYGKQNLPTPTISLNDKDEMSLDFSYLDTWLDTDGARFLIASEWWRRNCHLFQALSSNDFMLRSNSKWYVNIFEKLLAPFDGVVKNTLSKASLAQYGDYQAVRKAADDETRALDKQVSHQSMWPWKVSARLVPVSAADANAGSAYKVLHDDAAADAFVTGRIMRMLNLACRKAGSKLVVVTLPTPNNMVFYFREIECLKKLGKEEGFSVIDANAKFPSLEPMEPTPYYYKSHFSPAGHRLIADTITEGLRPILK